MPTLLRMSVDKTFVCPRRIMYFEYKGVQFKLRQNNPRRWSDFLATIVQADDYRSPAAQAAYARAAEWASALAWETGFKVGVRVSSAMGWPTKYTLRNLKGNERPFPQLPFHGMHVGIGINRVAKVTTDEQREALALFRDARNSNNVMLSILLYWQVMIVGTHPDHVEGWVTRTAKRKGDDVWRGDNPASRLPVGRKGLGAYLQEDFRHAIAHLKRNHPSRTPVLLDNIQDEQRMWTGARALEQLARYYIQNELGLDGHLTLVKPRTGGFPRYLSEDEREPWGYRLAYPDVVPLPSASSTKRSRLY